MAFQFVLLRQFPKMGGFVDENRLVSAASSGHKVASLLGAGKIVLGCCDL